MMARKKVIAKTATRKKVIAKTADQKELADKAEVESGIPELTKQVLRFCLLGETALYCNAMSAKAQRELLLPSKRKNRSALEASLKHDVYAEFYSSMYKSRGDDHPTRIIGPAVWFKKAMMTAAKSMPGVHATEIGREVFVLGSDVYIYGVPALAMDTVRCADAKRTPDIRTRARLEKWATIIHVRYTAPLLSERDITVMMNAAGGLSGVGDWRIEKGSGNFGGFEVVSQDDPRFLEVLQSGGREAQDAAIADPETANANTDELWTWYRDEVKRRELKAA